MSNAVPCRLDTAVTSLTQDEYCVSVGMSSGSRVDYDLVVGADGISSKVRRLTLGSAAPGYTGVMIWRSLAPTRPRGVTNLMVLHLYLVHVRMEGGSPEEVLLHDRHMLVTVVLCTAIIIAVLYILPR